MKTVLQIVLWIAAIGFGYLIYQSVNAPIEFAKVKEERFQKVINSLKDIRNAQEAYKLTNGSYARDFKTLINFIDTGKYVITQQRDTSYLEFDKNFGIDMLTERKIIDTLEFVSVKDSLFKKDSRYKTLMNVPGAPNGEKFNMAAKKIEKSGYQVAVFEASTPKEVVLYDQPKDLVAREKTHLNVEEVNGATIKVGSLQEVSTNGNWPPIYDKKARN
jgi:type II secretory pathway pseudopilin PulG